MKYAKKNSVSLNPLDYNLILLGESGIGKTTLVYETAEKLVGPEGYMILSLGSEYGCDSIEGVNYINCPTWEQEYDEVTHSIGLKTLIDDIIENKTTDYPDLKMIAFDTLDQLFPIVEQEVIRRDNKARKEAGKPAIRTINEAMGGYMKGQDEAIAIVKELEADLLKVNIRIWKIAHCKTKEITDTFTGEPYQQLTAKLGQRYFSALKDEAHFMGLCYVDRDFIKEKKRNSKDFVNKITDETRKIKFRSEDYVVDNKSRFANIVEEIPLNVDEFIKALTDAIESESKKSGRSLEDTKKEQAKLDKVKEERVVEAEKNAKIEHELENVIMDITDFLKEHKTDRELLTSIVKEMKAMGYAKPDDIDSLENANRILKLCK